MLNKKVIINCPNNFCRHKLALPKTEKKLKVVCPICEAEFFYWKLRWYYRGWFIILTSLVFPPMGIILLWASPRYKATIKIGLTVCFSLIFLTSVIQRMYQDSNMFYTSEEDFEEDSEEDLLLEDVYLPMRSGLSQELVNAISTFYEGNINLSWQKIIDRYKKGVVLVSSFDKRHNEIRNGSGFLITKDGYMITNYHVISGAHYVSVKFEDGKTIEKVYLVAKDQQKDLAVLNISINTPHCFYLGNSDDVKIGEEIMVIGNPLGYLEGTVSDGIISAIRDFNGKKYIQITAPVSMGNSGGPLINKKGEVIGVVTAGVPPIFGQNLNFALPINYVRDVIKNK